MQAPKDFIEKMIRFYIDQWLCYHLIKWDDITEDAINQAWVYYRPLGLITVETGSHCWIKSLMYALTYKYDEIKEKYDRRDYGLSFHRYFSNEVFSESDVWEDEFMKLPGTAIKSGVSYCKCVLVDKHDNLNRKERLMFETADVGIMTEDDYLMGNIGR